MNTAMIKGILIGGLATVGITAGGMVGYQAYTQPKYAEVLAVKPVSETIKQAREECRDVAVQRKAPVKDENRIAGTVIGGVIGGGRHPNRKGECDARAPECGADKHQRHVRRPSLSVNR